jgi:hypothetical protein
MPNFNVLDNGGRVTYLKIQLSTFFSDYLCSYMEELVILLPQFTWVKAS